MLSTGQSLTRANAGKAHTWTSWALTGFVATTFLAGAVVWNDRLADLRALGNVFLNIVSNSYVVDDVVNEEERKGN